MNMKEKKERELKLANAVEGDDVVVLSSYFFSGPCYISRLQQTRPGA
jgi:hypothetical protein